VILIVIPGPNVALIVANSVAHGARYGLITVAGTSSAVVVHLALTVLGATAVPEFPGGKLDWLRWLATCRLSRLVGHLGLACTRRRSRPVGRRRARRG